MVGFWRKELPAKIRGKMIGSRTEDGDTTRDGKVKQQRSVTDMATRLAVKSDLDATSTAPTSQ